jgi:hypothetical protein
MSTFYKFVPMLSSAILLASIGISAHANNQDNQNNTSGNTCLQQAREAGLTVPEEVQEFFKECEKARQEDNEQGQPEQSR